jgi:hypothetical protein
MAKLKIGTTDSVTKATVLPKSVEKKIITITQEVPVEIPVEITKELIREVPVEVVKEVQVEVIKEVIKEVPVEVIKEIEKIIEIPVIKVQERIVEDTAQIDKLKVEVNSTYLINVDLSSKNLRLKENISILKKQRIILALAAILFGVLYVTNL